jgi:hypothetical protein
MLLIPEYNAMCYKAIVQCANNYVINCKCNNNTINVLTTMQRMIQCTEHMTVS